MRKEKQDEAYNNNQDGTRQSAEETKHSETLRKQPRTDTMRFASRIGSITL